jgi:hypothetical protein
MIKAIALVAAVVLVIIWITWGCYVIVMALQRVKIEHGRLTLPQKVMGAPFLIIGYPLDMLVEKLVAPVLFREASQWTTFSQRLAAYVGNPDEEEWRKEQAHWWREKLLADFDRTGSHGKPGRQR